MNHDNFHSTRHELLDDLEPLAREEAQLDSRDTSAVDEFRRRLQALRERIIAFQRARGRRDDSNRPPARGSTEASERQMREARSS